MNTDPAFSPDSDDYDTPWKEAVESYLPELMDFFFPQASERIDWSRGYTFLEQELHSITRQAVVGRRFVDKLVRVCRHSGEEDLIYIHLEVQGTPQAAFARRMLTYHCRIRDQYQRPVLSLAVLADDSPHWRPDRFHEEVLGCHITLVFPIAKLLDYAGREAALALSDNPFALMTLAHLQTRATRHNPQARYAAKRQLMALLYRHGWERQRIVTLFGVLDWMMELPEALSKRLWQNIVDLEQENNVAYVTTGERIGIEKGLQQGREEGRQEGRQEGRRLTALDMLERLLTRRFGAIPPALQPRLQGASADILETWFDRVLDAPDLAAVFGEPP